MRKRAICLISSILSLSRSVEEGRAMENKRDYLILEDEVAITYENAYGPTWTRFFEGLKTR